MKKFLQASTLLLAAVLSQAAGAQGIYGDVNGDGEVTTADINEVVNVILGVNVPTPPPDEPDTDTIATMVFDTNTAARHYYRIPAIVQTADGKLLAIGDDRHSSFDVKRCHRVQFYGWARLGSSEGTIEITEGFVKNCGIYNATLRNVTIGDGCLIENIGNYMNKVNVGDGCYISNVSTIDTMGNPNYGQGHTIAVLNEVGDGNLLLLNELNSQLAAFMVKHSDNKPLMNAIKGMVGKSVSDARPDCCTIGNQVRIINTGVIINTIVDDGCQICGVSRLSNCTISSTIENPIIIRTGVICENTIISGGSHLNGSVKLTDCFVGESCHLENGFTAASSVFFANSYMSNGEACAAFCGPFTVSHHKSSLLIGAMFSFYNAGSATNFSNHAYKMGPGLDVVIAGHDAVNHVTGLLAVQARRGVQEETDLALAALLLNISSTGRIVVLKIVATHEDVVHYLIEVPFPLNLLLCGLSSRCQRETRQQAQKDALYSHRRQIELG